MSATPHANGGLLTRDLDLPDFRDFAVTLDSPGTLVESTRRFGEMCAEIYRRNPDNFRLFCPDETNSNRLGAVFEVVRPRLHGAPRPGRHRDLPARPGDGGAQRAQLPWLAGGLHLDRASRTVCDLRGLRHGVSASQTVQHSKWLEEATHLPWRAKVPSLNILLTSTAWRNDHNGFSHQGPGLIQNHDHSPRRSVAGISAPGRQLPAVGGQPLPPVPLVCQPHRDRQAATTAVAVHRRGDRALPQGRRTSGHGLGRTTSATTPTSCWPAPATS